MNNFLLYILRNVLNILSQITLLFKFKYNDKKYLKKIRDKRNKITHFSIDVNIEEIKSIVARGLGLFVKFYKEIDSYEYNKNLRGAGNSSTTKIYKFVDNNVMNGITYWYKLVDVDFNGVRTEHGPIFATPHAKDVQIDPMQSSMPETFELVQNFPNPFNPSTCIKFDIPEIEDGLIDVNITVFDMLGQKVKTLLESPLTAGPYQVEWDGTNDQNQIVPSGIYVYQFQSTLFNASKKMVLMQ